MGIQSFIRRLKGEDTVRLGVLPLILAFSLIVALFSIAIVISQIVASDIRMRAISITSDDAPSVKHLANARTELRHLQILAQGYVHSSKANQRQAWESLEASERRLMAEFDDFLALPTYEEENRGWERIQAALGPFRSHLDQIQMAKESGNTEFSSRLANGTLMADIDQLSMLINEIVQVDATHMASQARIIEQSRQRSRAVALVMGLAGVGLTGLLLLILVTRIRRHEKLVENHRRFLEARANEFEQFAAKVAHDILNPLSAAGLAFEGAAKCMEETPSKKALAYYDRGQRSLRQTTELVRGLLEFARSGAQSGDRRMAKLRASIDEAIMILSRQAEESGVNLTPESLPAEEVLLNCAPPMLMSILLNLVGNAIKYIGEGPIKEIRIRTTISDHARIEIEDTGPGIPAELQQVIFEPYFRAPGLKQGGLGLGLATVKKTVLSYGGRLGVRSRPGEGTTFWVELPLAPENRLSAHGIAG